MDLNEYQRQALETDHCPTIGHPVVYPAMGLCGEAGEVMEKIKKRFRDHDGVFTPESGVEIATECSDVLWYLAVAADRLGFTLDEIGQMNLAKLRSRKLRGQIHGSGDNR